MDLIAQGQCVLLLTIRCQLREWCHSQEQYSLTNATICCVDQHDTVQPGTAAFPGALPDDVQHAYSDHDDAF